MPTSLPPTGRPREEVLRALQQMRHKDAQWRKGRCFAYVYQAQPELDEFVLQAYQTYAKENAVNPGAFPSLHRMTKEIIEMCGSLFHLPKGGSGTFTSGGSESIFLAVLAARELFLKQNPNKTPEIIIPTTGHPAFHKAAHYFKLKVRTAAVNANFQASPQTIQSLVNENTALIVASAPSFPQGIIDPITEIGQIALKHNVPLHIDACIGGFILPFLQKNGVTTPAFDFSVPGVSSLSADLHKYGYSAKGASIVLFRQQSLRRQSFFAFTNWTGGLYGSTHITGSRSGGAIAAAWAMLQHLGINGYAQLAKQAWKARQQILQGIANIPELYVLGQPQLTLFAIASDKLNVYELADELGQMGWYIDRQQSPPSLHFNITATHINTSKLFLSDLAKAVKKTNNKQTSKILQKLPEQITNTLQKILPNALFEKLRRWSVKNLSPTPSANNRSAPLYGMAQSLKKDGQLEELIKDFLE